MKSIDIVGKRNIDKIQKIQEPVRKDTVTWNLNDSCYTYPRQLQLINMLYLEQDTNIEGYMLLKREINKKLKGYKNQDIQKELFDLNGFISLDQCVEKLVLSKLKCFYCKEKCELLYKNVFAKKQWTLDRIDNDSGHNCDNVVICCLECNIKRGDMDSERFKRGKEIKIVRKLL